MEINHFLFSHFVSLKKAENWISRVSFLSLTLSSRSISSQPSFSFHHHRPPYRPSPSLSATTTALPSLLRRFLGEFQAFSPNCSIFARNPNRPIVRFLGEFQAFSDMADSNIVRGVTRSKHTWTNDEDAKLIDALMEIHASGKYAGADNGFKPGYLNGVQQLLDVSLPNSGLKAEPHIKSRMKTWKTHFSIVYDMVHTSGFGWDEQKCCIIADDSVWNEYVKSHKGAVNFRDKAFPFYDKLCTIFGKDRATGSKAVDLGEEDVVQETQKSSPVDIEDFDFFDEAVPNVDRSEGQTGSVTSKRKRGRRMDADEIYRESCKDIKEVLLRFGEMVGEQLSKEGMEAREIYEKVSDELKGLPGITTKKRLKAAHLIGKDVDLGRSFLALTIEEKIEMVELYTDGSMG